MPELLPSGFPRVCLAAACCLVATPCHANVILPDLISDHMVLVRSERTPVWGQADPGEKVSVSLNGAEATTVADGKGRWKVYLDLETSAWRTWLGWQKAGPGPFEMTVSGKNTLTVKDVLIGEVWVASGQSNMEWPLEKTLGAEEEIVTSSNNFIREFLVERSSSLEPVAEARGRWRVSSPQTSGKFSAVAYYFAKEIAAETKRPVGIIAASWGGTNIENWMSYDAVERFPAAREEREKSWARHREHPAEQSQFSADMRRWIDTHRKNDIPSKDTARFAGFGVRTDDWQEIMLPRDVSAPRLPRTGILWLRKELTVPRGGGPLKINTPIDGYYSVYWDGKLVHEVDVASFAGRGSSTNIDLPEEAGSTGKHVLALRIYQPDRPAKVTRSIIVRNLVQTMNLDGPWLAKAEHVFPDPTPAVLAEAPVPPEQSPMPHRLSCVLFNGMIAPFLDYRITGVIWYQGESNAGRAGTPYRETFPALITDWRAKWGLGDFPFLFCQLANHKEKSTDAGKESAWAELREAQSAALDLPNTGQAVLIDLGEAGDIHPRNKRDVGRRLARIALAKHYGKDIPYSGPVFASAEFRDGKALISFAHTGNSLKAAQLPDTYPLSLEKNATAPLVRNSPKSELEGFAVQSADGQWHWAHATIEGETVVVSSPEVPHPTSVRYGWSDNPTVNLINNAGLPASPFRTKSSK